MLAWGGLDGVGLAGRGGAERSAVTGVLALVLLAMLVIMSLGWLVQRGVNNSGWVDVFWTYGTGACCAAAALVPFAGHSQPTWRQALAAALVGLWALRLGTYVAVRVARGSEDARYVELRREWGGRFQGRMYGLMIVQAPASTVLAIGVMLAARAPAPTLRLADVAGILILLVSVFGEGLADEQMKRFKADARNEGKVCDQGLWAWSRHPNYLFEFVGWLAYPVIAFDPGRLESLAALLAPALMFVILRFLTGVPPLEAAMVRSKGDLYSRYQARVSAFLPRPPRDAAA